MSQETGHSVATSFHNSMTTSFLDTMVASKQQNIFYVTTGGQVFTMTSKSMSMDVKHVNELKLIGSLPKLPFIPLNHHHDLGKSSPLISLAHFLNAKDTMQYSPLSTGFQSQSSLNQLTLNSNQKDVQEFYEIESSETMDSHVA